MFYFILRRPVHYELCLVDKSRLDEQSFMYRILFKDMYWTKLKWTEFYFLFYFIYVRSHLYVLYVHV